MQTEIVQTRTAQATMLTKAMRGNGLFSISSGFILLLFATPIADLMGLAWPLALRMIALSLIPYGLFLVWPTYSQDAERRKGITAVILDISWVVGSVIILLVGWPTLAVAGQWIVGLLAEAVTLFTIWQLVALRRLSK